VKATVVFKGREITYKEHGEDVLKRLTERLNDYAKVDQEAHMEGKSMIMIFAPERKKKQEQKSEESITKGIS
jgi:translation initiation factor IF-3